MRQVQVKRKKRKYPGDDWPAGYMHPPCTYCGKRAHLSEVETVLIFPEEDTLYHRECWDKLKLEKK